MRTLELRNGDLVLGPGGYSMVQGAAKVRQDLAAIVREAIGTDRFHPRFGTVLYDYLGGYQDTEVLMLIRAEVHRCIQNYMMVQSEQVTSDMAAGRRPRYTPDELVAGVDSVQVQSRYDRFNIKVTVSTASGDDVTLLRTVEV